MSRRTTIRHKLKVIFDTNALWTNRIDDLLSENAAETIKANSSHVDMEIEWLLPEMVVFERKRQMLEEAQKHVGGLNKIERLLGTNWAVSKENLLHHIEKSIEAKMSALGLKVKKLDVGQTRWEEIMRLAGAKRPPFQTGDTEKGFKDAIVGETFLQIVKDWLPADHRNKAILVCKDGLLSEWVTEQLPDGRRARVLADLEALKNDLNVLGSSVEPQFAAQLVSMAESLFFVAQKDDTFWYSAEISEKIREKFSDDFKWNPTGSLGADVKNVSVGNTIFLEKKSRTVSFSSKVEYLIEAYKYTSPAELEHIKPLDPYQISNLEIAQAKTISAKGGVIDKIRLTPMKKWFVTDLLSKREPVDEKILNFEVRWSAILTSTHRLTSPKLVEIVVSKAG